MKTARKYNLLNLAGALIFIGVLQWFMTVLAAETLFPGCSTRANDLSDTGINRSAEHIAGPALSHALLGKLT
jgi:hypothetical protein